ncbi:MAG: hypothetical protein HKO66_01275 [Saprospiraceae bacterium]|nr:hypothetical protein [Bacteroidia bacterium]NNE14312.1 hypothetical protein [Saprospiraceae bacterium]NNL90840.1 hypothetical protein [Saprospiraceae bacterium]
MKTISQLKLFYPKVILLFILCFSANFITSQNIIIDGSCEGHNTNGCDYNNSDTNFNGHFTNLTAFTFNGSGEIDIMRSTSCIGENPPVGATHLGIAHNGDLNRWDQFSFNLTTPIVAGADYDISFWLDVVQYSNQSEGNLEIGISTTSTSFGTLAFTATAPLIDPYTYITGSFTAPIAGNYLTVRPQATGATNRCWLHVDGFELLGEVLPLCDVDNANLDTMIMPVDTLSDYTFASEDSIVLTGKILAGTGADTFVDLRATSVIILNGPFESELGTRALIYIGACDGSMLFTNEEDEIVLKKAENNDAKKEDGIEFKGDTVDTVP